MQNASYHYIERIPRTHRRGINPAILLLTGLAAGLTLPAAVYVLSGAAQPCRHDLRCVLSGNTPAIEQAPGPWRYLSTSTPTAGARLVCYSGGAK